MHKVLVQLRMSADLYRAVKGRAVDLGQPVAALIVGAARDALSRPVVRVWEVARTKDLAAEKLACEAGQITPGYALDVLCLTENEITAQVHGLHTPGGPLGPESIKQYPGLAKPKGSVFLVEGWGYAEASRFVPVEPGAGREEKRLVVIFRRFAIKEARHGKA